MKLRFTSRAADELEEAIRYVRDRSPQGAERVLERIRQLTLHLVEHPYTGTLTTSGLRRITTNPYPYLIFYEVLGEDLVVIGVRHSARDPSFVPGA